MNRGTIIGITGLKRSGKDTLAYYIRNQDPSFVKYAFADPVRQAATAMFGFNERDYTDPELKESIDPFWGISPRQALQYIGTEVGRQGFAAAYPQFKEITDDQLWVKRFQRFLDTLSHPRNVVITDMRFQNEMNAIRNLAHVDYKVHTFGIVRSELPGDDLHASETEIPKLIAKCDHIFYNDRDIHEFYDDIAIVLRSRDIL